MKYFLSLFIIVFFVGIGHSQNKKKTKTLRLIDYKLEYPRTWKKKIINNYTLLSRVEKNKPLRRDAQVVFYSNRLIHTKIQSKIKQYLVEHASTLNPHEIDKKYEIKSIKNKTNFEFLIEYDLSLDSQDNKYKKVEYIIVGKSSLKSFSYMAKEELFEKYYDEAMSIINSVEKR